MKINKIKSVCETEDSINVMVDVEFNPDLTNRWELTDPTIAVTYNLNDDLHSNYMEILDRGQNVHGFELSFENQGEILSFLKENNIPQ